MRRIAAAALLTVLSSSPARAGELARNGFLAEWLDGRPSQWAYDIANPAAADPMGVVRDHGGAARVRYADAMGYAGIIQSGDVTAERGRTITVSGWLRRDGEKPSIGVWMLLGGAGGKRLDYVNSYAGAMVRPGAWGCYQARVTVPPEAVQIRFGAAIFDAPGTLWIRSMSLTADAAEAAEFCKREPNNG